MTAEQIQELLRKRGVTQKAIAEKCGVTPMAVSLVVRGRSVSRRVMLEVAIAIKKRASEVFPDHF